MEFCHTTTRARTIARRSGPVCAEAGTRSSCRMEKPASLRSESGLGSTPECCSASLWKYRSAPRQLKVARESSATRNRPGFGKIRIRRRSGDRAGFAALDARSVAPWRPGRSNSSTALASLSIGDDTPRRPGTADRRFDYVISRSPVKIQGKSQRVLELLHDRCGKPANLTFKTHDGQRS